MWRDINKDEKNRLLSEAVEFTGDHKKYGSFMLKVIDQFPIACEHNLTDDHINQKAWIGHAACFLATSCPEYITREAWGLLSDQQRINANQQAAFAISKWRERYEKKDTFMAGKMERQGVFLWHS